MDKYTPKLSKVLLTPDPHYIPGYTGYCPQLKYNFAKSYGKLTGELLTNPDVKHSNCPVRHTGRLPSTHTHTNLTLRGIPDSNLNRVISGYTGFIPKTKNFIGCNYNETYRKAMSEFFQEQQEQLQQRTSSLPVVRGSNTQLAERPKPPLKSVVDGTFTPPQKPVIEDETPHKYYISGFTGHVPKARFLIGKGYPIITNQALIQFRKQQSFLSDPDKNNMPTSSVPSTYPSNKSMALSVTGHNPGLDLKNTVHRGSSQSAILHKR